MFNQHGLHDYSRVSDDQFFAVVRARIRRARLHHNHSQDEVATAAGLESKTYQRLENPAPRRKFNPRLETLMAVARAVGLEIDELLRPATADEIGALEQPMAAKRTGRIRNAAQGSRVRQG